MILFIGQIQENKALLPESESHHMTRVLRMKTGDEVFVTDGKGRIYQGKIENAHNKASVIGDLIEIRNTQKRHYRIAMAVAPTKQIDRIEFFLEKSIELGLDHFYPIVTFNSERRKINHDRLTKIGISAMKQSLKAELPHIADLQNLKSFLESQTDFSGQKFIAHCHSEIAQTPIKDCFKINGDYQFLIGPEGDFSIEEVEMAKSFGYLPISLGQQRMRTETAALSCVMLAHWMHQ